MEWFQGNCREHRTKFEFFHIILIFLPYPRFELSTFEFSNKTKILVPIGKVKYYRAIGQLFDPAPRALKIIKFWIKNAISLQMTLKGFKQLPCAVAIKTFDIVCVDEIFGD
jgi:hypothetical protein